jgi:hypothetical protein
MIFLESSKGGEMIPWMRRALAAPQFDTYFSGMSSADGNPRNAKNAKVSLKCESQSKPP